MKINTNNNVYTIVYATVMVVIVALLLAVVSAALRPRQDANVKLDTQKQILFSLYGEEGRAAITNANAAQMYEQMILEKTCDKCGLNWMEANVEGNLYYIIPLRGAGLWGPIWGYISLEADKKTVHGVYFNHEGETPGLGGEIKNYTVFQHQFEGKPILGATGNGLTIEKAGNGGDVDCISGATITSKGVETMIQTILAEYVNAGWFSLTPAPSPEGEGNEEVENVEQVNLED